MCITKKIKRLMKPCWISYKEDTSYVQFHSNPKPKKKCWRIFLETIFEKTIFKVSVQNVRHHFT